MKVPLAENKLDGLIGKEIDQIINIFTALFF